MMKIVIFIILLLTASIASSQTYGNEWIDYSRPHYVFQITQDGVYRISYQAMDDANIPVNTITPDQFQIFGKEKEQPIRVIDGGDNSFDPGDYIEFFAEKNDGWLDSTLYDDPNSIGNPEFSLYNDTLTYFLTWKTGSHKRYIEETDVNFSNYTPSPYIIKRSDVSFNNRYYGGRSVVGSYRSVFEEGEGWGSLNYNGANGYTLPINVSTPNPYQGGDAPDVSFHGKSNANSNASATGTDNHHLRWEVSNPNYVIYDETFNGYRHTEVNEQLSPSLLNNGNTTINFRIIGDLGAATDFQSVHYLYLEYAKEPNLNGNEFDRFKIINNSSAAKVRLDLTNANLTDPTCLVTGGGIDRSIPLVESGGVWRALIPNALASGEQQVVIASENEITEITSLKPVNGDGLFQNIPNINFESAYIMIYHNSLQNASNQYESYRSSPAGGNHNTVMLNIDELYLQFGGGVNKHINSIRRLAHLAHNVSTEKPVGLLLMGKGIQEANEPNSASNSGTRKNQNSYQNCLIPSFGFPASDISITNRLNGTSLAPLIPTGRIAARNDAELAIYLNKIQVYENAQNQSDVYNKPNKEWQKQILHFGGGGNAQEHTLFKVFLNNYKASIEGPDFGGNVTSYFKTTSNPFNPVMSSEVNEILESGVSLMTFFGHASSTGFDQNIDAPENWGNTGKYPMVIGNSCYTGDIFKPGNSSVSEDFVLTQDLGSIGFISSTKLGFASYLNIYTSELYKQISPENYALPFAQQVVNTIANIESPNTNFLLQTTISQMTLHGDPAMRLNWHGLPEIDLTEQDIFFNPSTFDLTTDSLEMNIVLTNLGKSVTDTFKLDIRRNFPSSSIDSTYSIDVFGLNYKDTLTLKLPVQPEIGIGMNNFSVQADIPSFVPELYDEIGNNEVSVDLFINVDGIMPVLPYNYAVVPDDSVVLKASTINPIADFNSYLFEIDTTDQFNSPFKKRASVSGLGGVKEVFPNEWINANSNSPDPLVLEDSMAYFWRVAVDSTSPLWVEHSFQYIKGKEGWGQDHFFQFKNGNFVGVEYNRTDRLRAFEPLQRTVHCQVYDNANSSAEYNETHWEINDEVMEYNMCSTAPSIHVAVIDPATMEPWETTYNGLNPQNNFGQVNPCRPRPERYFVFRQNSTAQLQALDNMIANEVPEGHYLLIYTARFAQFDNWSNLHSDLFTTMQNLGATGIQPSNPNRAFIFLVKKGDASTAEEVYASTNGEFITLTTNIFGVTDEGIERSTIIGPAANWETLYWKQDAQELSSEDKTKLTIRALDVNQNVQLTIDTTFTANDSIMNLNNLIPAQDYPYLQLQASYKDTTDQTPAQVDRWHVLYEVLPEAAIDGSNPYSLLPISQDSLQEGQDIKFAVDVKNISKLPMDSLLINYWVMDQNQQMHPIDYQRQDSLRVGEVLRDTISFSTVGLAGNNVLWMEVNPYNSGINNNIKDQPELAHFNNILQLPFSIGGDDLNPVLDVTFDGLHILNGDIVNPNAEVVITLKDDNPFLVMENDADTSLFGVYLTPPNGDQERIPFIKESTGEQLMQWIPADGDNLKFKIIFPTKFEEDGTYELLVQGADKSGNISGDLEYRVNFDVIMESSITHMMNYPNPFSTKTQFVFTLTGYQVPDELMIQIMTVTGRIVKTITQDELGDIRIGRNVTDYYWDGRDEFGDQLANGVYLYRVTTKIDGETIEHRSSGADQHFKKNWGKMYLMR